MAGLMFMETTSPCFFFIDDLQIFRVNRVAIQNFEYLFSPSICTVLLCFAHTYYGFIPGMLNYPKIGCFYSLKLEVGDGSSVRCNGGTEGTCTSYYAPSFLPEETATAGVEGISGLFTSYVALVSIWKISPGELCI